MRRTALSTFLVVAILSLGCIGVVVPGKADEHCEDTSDPRYDPSECAETKAARQANALRKDYPTWTRNSQSGVINWKPLAEQGDAGGQRYPG